jgi:phenylacetate-CoA ligase
MERISKEELERVQLGRLRYIVKYAYQRSPFYRRKFDEAGVKPADLRRLADIRKFPFTTKEDVRRFSYPYGGEFLCVPREKLVCWHMTSGTTGKPTVGPYTYRDYELWMNIMARTYIAAGVKPGDIIMNIYGYGLFTGGMGFHQSAHLVGATVIPWSAGRTDALVDTLRDFKATVMTGTPSYQYYISEVVRKRGLDPEEDLSLRVTIPGAEMWTQEMRERIEEGFALKAHGGGARNVYGATELCGPGPGQECMYENGFHFWTDHWYLEVLDPKTHEPVQSGEEGEMVVTTLTKEAMPLVRYRMGDITILDTESCACGRVAYPRCQWVRGRVDDVIHIKGTKVWPSAVQEALLEFPMVREYQIVVDRTTPVHEFIIKIELDSSQTPPGGRERIEGSLRRSLFIEPKVEFLQPGSLPRYEGKSKRVIVKEVNA